MKFSERWLREFVNPPVDSQTLLEQLTRLGLEVDSSTPVCGHFSKVVVGEVIECEPHPNADRLKLCKVSAGSHSDEPLQIVCGAPNARTGLKAPLAILGAQVGDITIKAAKLRGIASQGMLCSAFELGLGEGKAGLLELPADAPVGEDFRSYLQLDDTTIDIELTPNRGDCLSVLGVAREVAAINELPLTTPEIVSTPNQHEDTRTITLESPEDCWHYAGRIIKGVAPKATTPLWMQEKLRRCGLRSLGPLVDVTNYVMLELGQPMHAFDLAQLDGGIVVRRAKQDETLQLLDETTLTLTTDDVVIADESKALALAGVMGGEHSGIQDDTTDILLESAFFRPEKVAVSARSHGLHTDSSHRFERGVDPTGQLRAIDRATELLLQMVGGQAGPVFAAESTQYAKATEPTVVTLRQSRLERMLSLALPEETVTTLLNSIGESVATTTEGWTVTMPAHRFDLAIEADLVEEVARFYGYDNLPSRKPSAPSTAWPAKEQQADFTQLRQMLTSFGFLEAVSYSFVSEATQKALDPTHPPKALLNPISSELGFMRSTLLSGLVEALSFNQNRQQPRVRLFELGTVFIPDGAGHFGVREATHLAGVMWGTSAPEGWANPTDKLDFFHAKGVVERLLATTESPEAFHFTPSEHPALCPGKGAEIHQGGTWAGRVGALHPEVIKTLGLTGPVFVFELDVACLNQPQLPNFKTISKFPAVRRDIALVVDTSVQAGELCQAIRDSGGDLLTDVTLFDVFQGEGIPENKKSLALGLTLQHPDRTLTDYEVSDIINEVTELLTKKFQGQLRT